MPSDEDEVRAQIQAIATNAFPDDTGVDWHVRRVTQKAGVVCVEAEPVPATAGYPRFRFVLVRGKAGTFEDVGCYCLDRGAWQLLYTTPASTGQDWRGLGFDAASCSIAAAECPGSICRADSEALHCGPRPALAAA